MLAIVISTELAVLLAPLVVALGFGLFAVISNNDRVQTAMVAIAAALVGVGGGGGGATLAADESGESAANDVQADVSKASEDAAAGVKEDLGREIERLRREQR